MITEFPNRFKQIEEKLKSEINSILTKIIGI